ncbi:hypothetical protein SAMN06273572_101415 [Monaibacterium marinum]|uniref:Replication restart DNA helicase PriA n=1 Tax=Pontivivens marinum TaxID=1690039 RepID=A0A2C9CMX7_9RHOB|nr:primosomal protein N' (replication factor Y) - superfamily II helicase [Monaibacterium marinum]SOH92568.1 hypothetical protein SAMN06273572_101415 [Monaibacterium marinum]
MGELETHRFPCGTCGSDLRFAPGERLLRCDHCGATEGMPAASPWDRSAVAENDIRGALATTAEPEMEETRVVQCTSCGAQVEFDPNEHAAECPFCASPMVTGTGINRHIKPRGILPFDIDQGGGQNAMQKWLRGLWFAPNALKKYARSDHKLQGIYLPYWTFDAQTETDYRGQRGTKHKRTVSDGKKQTTIRWRPVSGHVSHFFDDVLVTGSRTLPENQIRKISHFDLSALEPYRPQFLAGFRAEAYSIDVVEAKTLAEQMIDGEVQTLIKRDIGGDRQRIDDMQVTLSDVTYKHILVPVWIAAYRFRGKSYRFVVNARTGAVTGERPWSPVKIAIAVVLGAIAAGIVAFISANS